MALRQWPWGNGSRSFGSCSFRLLLLSFPCVACGTRHVACATCPPHSGSARLSRRSPSSPVGPPLVRGPASILLPPVRGGRAPKTGRPAARSFAGCGAEWKRILPCGAVPQVPGWASTIQPGGESAEDGPSIGTTHAAPAGAAGSDTGRSSSPCTTTRKERSLCTSERERGVDRSGRRICRERPVDPTTHAAPAGAVGTDAPRVNAAGTRQERR